VVKENKNRKTNQNRKNKTKPNEIKYLIY